MAILYTFKITSQSSKNLSKLVIAGVFSIFNLWVLHFTFFGNMNRGRGFDKYNAVNIIGGSSPYMSNIVFWITFIIFSCALIGSIFLYTINDEK